MTRCNLLTAMLSATTVLALPTLPLPPVSTIAVTSEVGNASAGVAAGFLAKLQRLDAQNAARADASTHPHRQFRRGQSHSRGQSGIHPGVTTAAALSAVRAVKAPVSPPGSNVVAVARTGEDAGIVENGLKAGEPAADVDETTLSEATQEADEHLLNGSSLHHNIVVIKSKLQSQKRVRKKLEGQGGGLKKQRDALSARINKVMNPKLNAARGRLEHEEEEAKKFEQEAEGMNATVEKMKESASKKVKKAEDDFKVLKEADAALAAAKISVTKAANEYANSSGAASEDALMLREAEVRSKGRMSRALRMRKRVKEQVKSVKQIQGILKTEDSRVQAAYNRGVATLKKRVKDAADAEAASKKVLGATKKKYKAWQVGESARAKAQEKRIAEHAKAAEAKRLKLHEAWEAEQAKAVKTAERKSTWDISGDWAWSGPEVDGEEVESDEDDEGPAPAAAPPAGEAAAPDVKAEGSADSTSGASEVPSAMDMTPRGETPTTDTSATESSAKPAPTGDPQKGKEEKPAPTFNAFDADYIKDENGENSQPESGKKEETQDAPQNFVPLKQQSGGAASLSPGGDAVDDSTWGGEAGESTSNQGVQSGDSKTTNQGVEAGESTNNQARTSVGDDADYAKDGDAPKDKVDTNGGDADFVKDGDDADIVDTKKDAVAEVLPPAKAKSKQDYVNDENDNAADQAWFEQGLHANVEEETRHGEGEREGEGEGGGKEQAKYKVPEWIAPEGEGK